MGNGDLIERGILCKIERFAKKIEGTTDARPNWREQRAQGAG
jgi:hypothetical protein